MILTCEVYYNLSVAIFGSKHLTDNFFKGIVHLAKPPFGDYDHFFSLNKLYIYLLQWPKSGTLTTPHAGEEMVQQQLSFVADGNVKWSSLFGR